jgi:hypothetical protein
MITDRIAMTANPLGTIQCEVKILDKVESGVIFQFQNYLLFTDISGVQRYKITRYSLDDIRGIVTLTAIEFKHANAPIVSGATRIGNGDTGACCSG